MLGLSGGELAAIVLMGVLAFGPKEVPRVARGAGKMVGRAMGYLFTARDRVRGVADRAELMQLQSEVRETVAKLEEIRRDAIRGVQFLPDAPTFASRPLFGPTHPEHSQNTQGSPAEALGPTAEPPDLRVATPLPGCEQRSGSQTQFPVQSTSGGVLIRHLGGGIGTGAADSRLRTESHWKSQGQELQDQGFQIIPVSAQSAGMLPRRRGVPSGSDVLSDSLLEEQIAVQASRFMQDKGFVVREK